MKNTEVDQKDIPFPCEHNKIESSLIGKLVHIKSPGMLLVNKSSDSDQIFDLGGPRKRRTYLFLSVDKWSYESDTYVSVSLLLNDCVYVWRGVKVSKTSMEEFLTSRFKTATINF